MKKAIVIILIIAIIGAAGFAAVKIFTPKPQEILQELSKELEPKVEHEMADIQDTLNEIGELSTAEYVYEICQVTTKEGMKIPFTDKAMSKSQVIYSYSGTIKAGIKFGDIDVDVREKTDYDIIYVKLPKVEVFSNELDNDSLRIYSEKQSHFTPINFEDFNEGQEQLKSTAQERAVEKGLLKTAEENAKNIIETNILGLYHGKECEIIFK